MAEAEGIHVQNFKQWIQRIYGYGRILKRCVDGDVMTS